MDLNEWNNIIQILVGVGGSGGLLLIVFKLIKKFIVKPIVNHIAYVTKNLNEISILSNKLNKDVLPIINSLNREFSVNSGKSIKDQINQIGDSVRLAELRSKLIASSFTNIGLYECSPTGECIWVNKALCDIFGLSHEEIMGNGWLSGVCDEERAEVLEKWMHSIKNNIPYDTEYTVCNMKTDENFTVRTMAFPNKTIDGKILGYYGQVTRS